MDTIDKQQYQTLIVQETLPKEEKSRPFLWVAILTIIILMLAQIYSAWGVRQAHQ
jgi:mxaC protein